MKKILLIEDDPLIVEIYTAKLKKSGFDIESAIDGKSAFEKFSKKEYDLILLDIVLPHLTGFELLERMKRQKKSKQVKVVVLSNLGEEADIKRAQKMNVVKYLIKAHHTPSEVVEEIKKILK